MCIAPWFHWNALKYVPWHLGDDKSTLIHTIAWCHMIRLFVPPLTIIYNIIWRHKTPVCHKKLIPTEYVIYFFVLRGQHRFHSGLEGTCHISDPRINETRPWSPLCLQMSWTKWPLFRHLKRIFVNEKIRILIKMSLKFVPKDPTNTIPLLVQIMARCRPGDKTLSEAIMVRPSTHICVTRPECSSRQTTYYKVQDDLVKFLKLSNVSTTFSLIMYFQNGRRDPAKSRGTWSI